MSKIRRLTILNRRLGFTTATIFTIVALLNGISYVKLAYENAAVNHFQHSVLICKPFLSGSDEAGIVSQFSQVQNRDGYIAVINKLDAVAKAHGVHLREFTVW